MAWGLVGNIRGLQGVPGVGVTYRDTIADETLLPTTGQAAGDMYVLLAAGTLFGEGHAVIWDGTNWDDAGPWLGPEGPQGTTGTRGSVWNVGTNTATELNTTNPIAGTLAGDLYLKTDNGDVFRFT